MPNADLISPYNYDSFLADEVISLLDAYASPPLGQTAPDFPLYALTGGETMLSQIWSSHSYTVVEFGSFT